MKLTCNPPPVYFMHVPRTAGSSFRRFLHLVYPRRRTVELSAYWQLQRISLAELRSFDCYLCHFGPSLYDLVDRPDLPCITILRDPVERFISTLYYRQWYVKHHPEPYAQEYLEVMAPLQDADLRTLLATPAIAELERDAQTRHLGLGAATDLRSLLRDGSVRSNARQVAGNPFRDLPAYDEHAMARVAANARARLDRMAVVMITERFDESMELAADLLGAPLPSRAPQMNIGYRKTGVDVHSYRATIPPDLIRRVEELTIYDRGLYEYACQLFEQQYARYQEQPRRTYSVAPRLLMPARAMAAKALAWLHRTYPESSGFSALRWLRSRARGVL